MERTGKCPCGSVSCTAKGLEPRLVACHCGMSRRWTGGPLMAVSLGEVAWV